MSATTNRFLGVPHSKPGWWSVGFAVLFLILLFLFTSATMPIAPEGAKPQPALLPNLGCFTVILGLGTGITGLIAIIRKRERSLFVWLSLLPGVFSLSLLVVDLIKALLQK